MRARSAIAALAFAASTAGCQGAIVAPLRYGAPSLAPEEPFRNQAPAAAPVTQAVELPWHATTLLNGVRVLVLERHALPVVSLRLVLDRGAADTEAQPDAYSILERALRTGTEERTAGALLDVWAGLGATHGASLGPDGGVLSAEVGTNDFDEAIALLAETTRPRLTEASFDHLRAHWTRDLDATRFNANLMRLRNARALLFGHGHAYGYRHPAPTSTNALRVEDVSAIYGRIFRPAHAVLVVVGDIKAEAVEAVASRLFGSWRAGAEAPLPFTRSPPPEVSGAHVVHVERRDDAETLVSILVRGPGEGSTDLAALEILARNFGARASRMHGDVREEQGAAYVFGAVMHRFRTASYLEIQTALAAPKSMPALRGMLAMIAEVARSGISEAELSRGRAALLSSDAASVSATGGIASLAVDALVSGRPLDDLGRYRAKLQAVTTDDIRRVASRYLVAGALRVVVVGSPSLRPELERLGLGPVEGRDLWTETVVSR